MPNNKEVVIISATLSSQEPTGPRGPQGLPAFIQFNIVNGCLIVEQAYDNYIFVITNDGDLVVNFQEDTMASVNLGKVVGDSAYEVAVAQGYTGTESEWLASLKGADGFSPIATVVKTDSVATITITDINGTTTASVYDGTGGGGSSYTDADTAAYIKNTFGMSEDQEDVCSGEIVVTGSNLATPIQAADWVNNTELTTDVFAERYPYFWITSQYNEGPHSFKAYIDGYGMGGCQYVGELGAGVSLTMTVSVDMDFDTDSDLGNPKITRFDLDDGGSSVSTELPMTIWFEAKTPLNDMFIPSEIVRSIQLEEALPQPDGETIVRNENNV